MINVYFDLVDSSNAQLFMHVLITPYGTPCAYSGSVVSSDAIRLHYVNAPVTASLVPNTYAVRYCGRVTESEFLINLPSSSDGQSVTASAYLVACPPYAGFTASCAQSLIPPGGSFQVVNGQPQIWDIGLQQWVTLTCQDGILGVTY
jgi:hypothetical protein